MRNNHYRNAWESPAMGVAIILGGVLFVVVLALCLKQVAPPLLEQNPPAPVKQQTSPAQVDPAADLQFIGQVVKPNPFSPMPGPFDSYPSPYPSVWK